MMSTRKILSNFMSKRRNFSTENFLKDSFHRKHEYLRISLTEKCNLRCKYCMPADGVSLSPSSSILSTEEIIKLSTIFVAKLGVKKIRLTGGEPLIRKDVLDLVSQLNGLKNHGLETIGITTNGIKLSRLATELKNNGVDTLNISLDTLKPSKFESITRRNGFHLVLNGIRTALETGFKNQIKLNVVLMKNFNDDEIIDFINLTKFIDLDVRFIEYMPFDGNNWNLDQMVPFKDVLNLVGVEFGTQNVMKLEPKSLTETSKPFKISGFVGQFGFISSMTDNFCATCNRLRITADGNLKVCLFGKEEVSLREAVRSGKSDDEIINVIKTALIKKRFKHDGAINISKSSNRPMILIAKRNFSSSVSSSDPQNVSKLASNNQLTHLNSKGEASMVDVSSKEVTLRTATASGVVILGVHVVEAILASENISMKGDVVTVSKVAGILGAKSTTSLLPMTHHVPLSHVAVDIELNAKQGLASVTCTAKTSAQTGVEMEALTGVSITCLTLYDMCKSMDKGIVIKDIKLIMKTGGKSGDHHNKGNN